MPQRHHRCAGYALTTPYLYRRVLRSNAWSGATRAANETHGGVVGWLDVRRREHAQQTTLTWGTISWSGDVSNGSSRSFIADIYSEAYHPSHACDVWNRARTTQSQTFLKEISTSGYWVALVRHRSSSSTCSTRLSSRLKENTDTPPTAMYKTGANAARPAPLP